MNVFLCLVFKKLIRVYETLPFQSNKYVQFVKLTEFPAAKPAKMLLRLPLFIQGDSNAHILISPKLNPTALDDTYEIILGAWQNRRVIIHKRIDGAILADVTLPRVLSQKKLKKFVLDIHESKFYILFGRGTNLTRFASLQMV